MNISKSSQLYQIAYRYNNTFKGPRDRMTLCQYIRCVFLGLINMSSLALLFLLWSSQVLFVILAIIVGLQYGFYDVMHPFTIMVTLIPFLIIGVYLILIVGVNIINELEDKTKKLKIRKAGEEWRYGKKEHGLIRSYFKAIKDKVCPIVYFE